MLVEHSLIKIVKCVLDNKYEAKIRQEEWHEVIQTAQKHGLLVFVYYFINHLETTKRPDQETVDLLNRYYASEVRSDVLQMNAIEQMRKDFENSGIDNIFIKGAVTKTRYKNELLRSMGDIDFLYKAQQDSALKEAMTRVGFQYGSKGRVHDIYTKDCFVIAEAHRELLSPSSQYASFAKNIWEKSRLIPGYFHNYEMRIEDEIIFNLIHFASHFKKGGAGIRFVIDVWVYAQLEADWKYIEYELDILGLVQFYKNAILLAERWFGNSQTDSATVLAMEDYILMGGIFGTKKNRYDAVIAGGKIAYLRRAILPPYRDMRSMFPWLNNKLLLPYAWLFRIVQSLVKRRNNVKSLIQPAYSGNKQNADALAAFYKSCGL